MRIDTSLPITFAKYDLDGIKQKKEHAITLTLTLDSRDIISLSHEKYPDKILYI